MLQYITCFPGGATITRQGASVRIELPDGSGHLQQFASWQSAAQFVRRTVKAIYDEVEKVKGL